MGLSFGFTTPVLDPAQIAEFRATGFLIVRRSLAPPMAATVQRWATEAAALPEVSGRQRVHRTQCLKHHGHCLIRAIERLTPFHAGFRQLTQAFTAPAAQLLGAPAVLLAEKLEYSLPGYPGSSVSRDLDDGWLHYADCFVSVIAGIDDASFDGGSLQIAARRHRDGLQRALAPLSDADAAVLDYTELRLAPGDLVYLDAGAPYRASTGARGCRRFRATFNRLAAGDHQVRYYADRHQNEPCEVGC